MYMYMGMRNQPSRPTDGVFRRTAERMLLQMQRLPGFTATRGAALSAILLVPGCPPAPQDAPAATTAPAAKPGCASTYTVVSGDYWLRIAQKNGVTTSALYAANSASASTPLYPGNQLCLPAGATSPTTAPPATSPVTSPGTGGTSGVQLASFPVQGPCWFTDTWQAARSGGRRHEGVDIIGKAGLYVYAAQDGTLSKQTTDRPGSLSGNAWWLTGNDGTYFFYAHLSAFAPDLRVGSKVKAGQVIGFVGRTGNAAGNHLHFEVHPRGGAAVNPTPIVKAVDGCQNATPPAQPSGTVPPNPGAPATTAPATTAPATTAPGTTVPATVPPAAPTNTAPPTPNAGAKWQFIAPKTAFDSAWNGRPVAARTRQTIRVSGLAGVPSGTAGAVVRLTATGASAAGYLVTHPCDVPAPAVSTLSFTAGGTAVGSAVVEVVGGNVCLTTSTSVRVKLEVLAAQASTGVGVVPVNAARVLDTRTTTRLVPGSTVSLSPATLGVGADTQALTASITIVGPERAGVLSLGFCGQGPWTTPFSAEPVSSFAMTMRVNSAGWCLSSSVPVDVIVDVVGNWSGASQPATVDPIRVFDSRAAGGPVSAGGTSVPIAGLGGVPGHATTAVLSVTTVAGGSSASVFAGPCGQPHPGGTVIATSPYRINSAVVPVALGGGAVCFWATQPVDVIVDVLAWS